MQIVTHCKETKGKEKYGSHSPEEPTSPAFYLTARHPVLDPSGDSSWRGIPGSPQPTPSYYLRVGVWRVVNVMDRLYKVYQGCKRFEEMA